MVTIKNGKRRIACISALIIIAMIFTGCFNMSYATLKSVPPAKQIEKVSSNVKNKKEYFTVKTPLKTKGVIQVEGKVKTDTKRLCIRVTKHKSSTASITVFVKPNSKGEFSVKISTAKNTKKTPTILNKKGTVAKAKDSYETQPGYKAVPKMTAGTYHLTIAKATTTKDAKISRGSKWWNGPLGGSKGYVYKDVLMTIKPGQINNPKVIEYTAAVKNNKATTGAYEKKSYDYKNYKGSYVRYQDVYMKDMAFVFKNPKTGKQENMTSSKVKFIKSRADSITKGAKTDYDKMLKIYEYVASNIYYDVLANEKYKNQYANPYTNLYNLKNKKTSANSKSGKVATTCQGYASMVIAMARAEGIPARLVYGHHISQPLKVWSDVKASKIDDYNHWWAEAWVDGRWIVIDANAATYSKWNRSSFSSSGTWSKGKGMSYEYFDPTPEILANSYAYIGVYHGATDGKYINRASEISQLQAFLNTKSEDGVKNGTKLNAKYSSTNFATWTNGVANNFLTDGYGRVTHMLWGNIDFVGKLDLTNFSELKYLTVYNSSITDLTLKGCSQLINISANYNDLQSFDSSASKNTETISLQGNKLNDAKFKHNGKTVTIKAVGSKDFGFVYKKKNSKQLTIYANGGAFIAVYDSNNKKVASGSECTFKINSNSYFVK